MRAVLGPKLTAGPKFVGGTRESLAHLPMVRILYDLAIHTNKLGGAAAVWCPLHDESLTVQLALHVFEPPTDEKEWMSSLVPLYHLAVERPSHYSDQ